MSSIPGSSKTVVPPRIPGYDVFQMLGQGGMGRVYLARQHTLSRIVCIKVLALPFGEVGDACRERFRREAEILAMATHPHVLTIFDFGATADTDLPYLVSEHVEGGDLRKMIRDGRPVSIAWARSLLLQIGDALGYLHRKGILHRDLKPENILMSTDSLVKVADFGMAVLLDQRGLLTQTNQGLGTLGYAAPEQQNGGEVDERSDQYSLAAMAYELVTGRRPMGSFKPPSEINPALHKRVDAVLMKGLAQEPGNRYGSLTGFLNDLDRALAPSARASQVLAWTGAGLTAILIAGSLFWALRLTPSWPAGAGGQVAPEAVEQAVAPFETKAEPVPDEVEAASPEFHRLTEIRAYQIWLSQGSPTGAAGEAVSEKNWFEAERQITQEVEKRAYQLWVSQGRPAGAEGEAVRERNKRRAEADLLKEAENSTRPVTEAL